MAGSDDLPASADDLRRTLRRIDGRGYRAYQELHGRYSFAGLELCVDHVQGDPFAAPSKLRLRVPAAVAGFPPQLFAGAVRRLALEDLLARTAAREAGREPRRRGSGGSGGVHVDAGGQEVLERTAARLTPDSVELRLSLGLPAAGRRVLGREAEALLCDDLPRLAERSLRFASLDEASVRGFVACVEGQERLRGELRERGLVAFVADGAVLPRESGRSDRPLPFERAVAFRSPDSLRVTLPLANPIETPEGLRSSITGMGIRRGVTLVVGGGYHGKSTLLRALERCVYPHVPGDGREWVVSDPGLVKIRAEDGRRVEQVDIAGFVADLPQGRSTRAFSSDDASGSTSQAASIMEALEAGASGLLLDEDTSATNLMLRDARMQALVHRRHEPITPFLERVRELYERFGVSSVLVMGSCGDYFDVADTVIAMREFLPQECTAEARRIAAASPSGRRPEAPAPFAPVTPRVPEAASLDASRGRRRVRIAARGVRSIEFGSETIDLAGVEQLVDVSQTRAVGFALELARSRLMDGEATLREVCERLEARLDAEGLDVLGPFGRAGAHPGDFARPRALEVAAAMNRLRTLRMRQRPRAGGDSLDPYGTGGARVPRRESLWGKAPDHRVDLEPAPGRWRATLAGEVVAESARAILVHETRHAPVVYFPRDDVRDGTLERSRHETFCPFKGEASHWNVRAGGCCEADAAWSYEDPFREVGGLRGHVAFYADRVAVEPCNGR